MKKNMKKTVGLFAALSIAASLAVPVAFADTPAVTNGTTLEMEDFLTQNADKGFGAVEKDTAHGGGYVYLNSTSKYETQTYTVTFNADKAGAYALEIGASERGANDWISPVKMTVNGEDYGFFWNADNTAGAFTRGAVYTEHLFEGGTYNFRSYKTKTDVNLSAGENTIEFTAYTADGNSWNNNGTQVVIGARKAVGAGFDYITFTREEPELTEVSYGTTLEAETCLNQNNGSGFVEVSKDTASGGALVFLDSVWHVESKSYSMSFNVTKAGIYDLEIGAADRGSNDWISPVKVTINGEDYGFLWNADNTADGFTRAVRGYTARGAYNFNKYQTKTPVTLPEGENTIVFTGYSAQDNSWNNNGTQQKVGASDNVSAGVDYIKFNKPALPEVSYGTTLEAETCLNQNNGSGFVEVSKDTASGGALVFLDSVWHVESKSYSMSFDVTTAGTYNLEIGAADRGSNDWISPVKVTINGEDYGFLWNADNTADGFTRAVRGYTARGAYNFNKYQTKTPVKLSEGENTIVFTGYSAQDNSWNNNGTQQKVGASDNVSAGVDYVAFSKFAARKITDGDTVELEEFINLNNDFGTAKADALSDGVAATVEKYNPAGEKTYSFSVDADAAGDYYLTAGIADRGAGDWQSAVKLTVNGTDVGYFRNSDYTEDAFACATVKYAKSGDYTFNKYVSKAPVALNEGDNEFVFTVYDANQNSFDGTSTGTASQLFAGLDYMTFNKARNISDVTMTVADTLAVGGVSEIVLKDGDGNVITASDVAQITYSSSLESVATVTAEGKVTGVKPGRTKISAEILVNAGDAETISASAWVNVVDDDIFIANVQISEDGKITFDVVNNTDFDDYENIKAIAASYLDGTMKSIADFSIESLLCGTSSACEMTLSGYEDGDDVYIYVWDGLGTMIPVMAEKKQY